MSRFRVRRAEEQLLERGAPRETREALARFVDRAGEHAASAVQDQQARDLRGLSDEDKRIWQAVQLLKAGEAGWVLRKDRVVEF